MSQPSRKGPDRWLLPLIILIYLVLGGLYAVYTPAWQAPDEPAHYNYVQYVAQQQRFPVVKPGDYPAAHLEEIKAARFPPEMSIAPIRYEFHQPPLYYLLTVPIYRLAGGALLPLRLVSVGLGALLLLVIQWTGLELAPGRPFLALGATAFVAFLPMHLAMTAAVNNDILAELLLAVILLLTIRYLRQTGSPSQEGKETRLLILLGVTTGLSLVTKSSVYFGLPLVLLAIVVRHLWLNKEDPNLSKGLLAMAVYLLPAIALAIPWWLRNMAIYGGADFLGLGRHDQVVSGQLRTAEFVAEHGINQLVHDFFLTSFRSFWAQFGWMGVLLDQRLYQALAILSALALVGFISWVAQGRRRRGAFAAWQWAAGGLLALAGLFTVATYVWYNTGFLQHQGRYLFRALVPISLVVALGWRQALRRDHSLPLAFLSLFTAAALLLAGLLSTWLLLMLVVVAAALAVGRFLPARLEPFVQSWPYLLLVVLDVASLFAFIVPQLSV